MSITISIDLGYEFDVKAPAKEVFALLSNVPESASHFPKLDQLVDLGKGSYRWEMETIGLGQITLQSVYACKYTSSKTKGTVTWTPVKDVGNAQVSGSWTITDNKKSTKLVLDIQSEVELPLPALMKMVAGPLVQAEFESLVEQYIDNLAEALGGEVEA